MHILSLIKLFEKSNLLFVLVFHLSPVLTEALELKDELIGHVPKPLVRQLHINDSVEDDLEEAAVIVPGVDPLLRHQGQAGVEVVEGF
ncbi:hypothetical protein ACFX1S_027920 [Malus domestica]